MIAVTIFYICVIGFWWAHRSYRAEKHYWESCDRQGKREHAWAELENALREPYDGEPKNAGSVAYETEPKSAGAGVYVRPVLISDGWCSCCQPDCSQCGRHVNTCGGCGSELAPGETSTCEWCIKDTYMRQRQEEEQQWLR